MSDRAARQRLATLAELGLLSATLAHEQRQPLFAVKSIAQLLERQVEGEAAALVRQMLEQIEHLERLVDGVGRYARGPEGVALPIDLRALAEGAAELMRHRAMRRRVLLRLEIEPGLGAAVGDATGVTQILVNLLHNAVDASPPEAEVLIRVLGDPDGLVVEVRDRGPGLDEDLLERAFEPFFSTKPSGEGTGLGLTISRELAESSGGHLSLHAASPGLLARLRLAPWPPHTPTESTHG